MCVLCCNHDIISINGLNSKQSFAKILTKRNLPQMQVLRNTSFKRMLNVALFLPEGSWILKILKRKQFKRSVTLKVNG